jgi:hypothetical protein
LFGSKGAITDHSKSVRSNRATSSSFAELESCFGLIGEARLWVCDLVQVDRLFKLFRARFIGKVSPVHFFWGSFDLAVTRFSGRAAPAPGGVYPNVAPWVMAEAYSHEVCSCGFWPGCGREVEAVPLF